MLCLSGIAPLHRLGNARQEMFKILPHFSTRPVAHVVPHEKQKVEGSAFPQ